MGADPILNGVRLDRTLIGELQRRFGSLFHPWLCVLAHGNRDAVETADGRDAAPEPGEREGGESRCAGGLGRRRRHGRDVAVPTGEIVQHLLREVWSREGNLDLSRRKAVKVL